MASVQHTVTGTSAPTIVPPSVCAHYIDTSTGRQWISYGNSSVEDWGAPLPGALQFFNVDVAEVTLPLDGTLTLWRANSSLSRTLVFPTPAAFGLFVVDLVVENTAANSFELSVSRDGGAFVNFGTQQINPAESRYFRFHCYVGADGYPYWTLIESRSLNLKVEAVSEFTNSTTNLAFAGDQPLTFWSIGDATARTITLSRIDTSYAATRDLVITNGTNSAMSIAVSADGLPLKDNASLSVPANGAVLFKLAFSAASGGRWSLISSTDL